MTKAQERQLVHLLREVIKSPGIALDQIAQSAAMDVEGAHQVVAYALQQGYLVPSGAGYQISQAGIDWLAPYKVRNAIVLAAGFGSRFVPLTYQVPKSLMPVKGKPLLERMLEQLLEVGVEEFVIVTGYLPEAFAYLGDKYGARLIYNPEYDTKNNIASLEVAKQHLDNSYVLVADIWMEQNTFHAYEADSWYSCHDFRGPTGEWCVDTDQDGRIRDIKIGGQDSLALLGPAYFSSSFSKVFLPLLDSYSQRPESGDYYWEHILMQNLDSLPMYANVQTGNVLEFESLDELRQFDERYINDTGNQVMEYLAHHLQVPQGSIHGILPVKTDQSTKTLTFLVGDHRYQYSQAGSKILVQKI